MRILPAGAGRKMILLDQGNREFPVVSLAAQSQIASRPGPIDASAQNENIKRLRPQPLNRVLPRTRINSGSHLYILECLDTPPANQSPTSHQSGLCGAGY